MGSPGPGPGPLAFVDDLDAPRLADDDRHHLARVLRLRTGDALVISDGDGTWQRARFGPDIEPVGERRTVAPPPVALTVAFAPVKGARPEWAVQKLTEIGVDAIWLLDTERGVVRWDEARGSGHAERLGKVAREAAMQSRRCRLPAMRMGVSVAAAVTEGASLAHPGGAPPDLSCTTVCIGPEGGWSDAELAVTAKTVDLGPFTLRTETAAVVAGTLIVALRERRVTPLPPPIT